MSDQPTPATDQDLRIAVANLEQRMADLSLIVDHQNMQISQLIDVVVGLRNSTDWSAAQFGELLRILFTGIQQIRDTQISSLISDGPITLAALQKIQFSSQKQAQSLIASQRIPEAAAHRRA
jgi:hypothetical protein